MQVLMVKGLSSMAVSISCGVGSLSSCTHHEQKHTIVKFVLFIFLFPCFGTSVSGLLSSVSGLLSSVSGLLNFVRGPLTRITLWLTLITHWVIPEMHWVIPEMHWVISKRHWVSEETHSISRKTHSISRKTPENKPFTVSVCVIAVYVSGEGFGLIVFFV